MTVRLAGGGVFEMAATGKPRCYRDALRQEAIRTLPKAGQYIAQDANGE